MVSKKIQKGGMPGALATVLSYISYLILRIFQGLLDIMRYLFSVCPNPDGDPNISGTCWEGKIKDWQLAYKEAGKSDSFINVILLSFSGPAWRFFIMAIKIAIAIAIFCLGGPIVLLGGIIFMYTRLYSQINTRVDDPSKTLNHKNDD